MAREIDVVVKKGDTLSAIASKYNTDIKKIMSMNPNIKDPNLINVGSTIKIEPKNKVNTENVELIPNTELKTVIGVNPVGETEKDLKADEIESKNPNNNKDIKSIAAEVMNGKWGNGDARRENLLKAGYNPDDVQRIINEDYIMKKNYKSSIDPKMTVNKGNNSNNDTLQTSSNSTDWSGSVLNSRDGVNDGPSGKESYYNLSMKKIASESQPGGFIYEEAVRNGNADNLSNNVWVRSDGVKMMGDYVMVAANLSVHPRGSLVPTSLGMGVVVDTGGFAESDPNQLDIAVNW